MSAALGGFLHTAEIEAASPMPDALARLRSGELQALVVHGVYAPGLLERVVERLERHDPAFLKTSFPEKFRSWFYGRNLNLTGPKLDGYFAEAARFHAQLGELFPAGLDLVQRVGGLLEALDDGRAFVAAPGRKPGERYMFTTLRSHAEGGYIPPHFDNEQRLRPSYRHLRGLVEPHILSFVLVLSQPEDGGALEVFDLRVEPEDAQLISDDAVADKPDVSKLRSVAFSLPTGSLIVLDSGRYLHRLTPVRGARMRWTACSFFACSRDGCANYCWG